MYDREDVELALFALEEGMTCREAGELVGARGPTISHRVCRPVSRRGHSPDDAACEGFFGRPEVELFLGRDWSGWTVGAFVAEPGRHMGLRDSGRPEAFLEGGVTVYDTTGGKRARTRLTA